MCQALICPSPPLLALLCGLELGSMNVSFWPAGMLSPVSKSAGGILQEEGDSPGSGVLSPSSSGSARQASLWASSVHTRGCLSSSKFTRQSCPGVSFSLASVNQQSGRKLPAPQALFSRCGPVVAGDNLGTVFTIQLVSYLPALAPLGPSVD